ncbi:hypothetical protein D3C78_1932580 [compost metagenome]
MGTAQHSLPSPGERVRSRHVAQLEIETEALTAIHQANQCAVLGKVAAKFFRAASKVLKNSPKMSQPDRQAASSSGWH